MNDSCGEQIETQQSLWNRGPILRPLGNLVYFPQIISDHITYNKQINMSRKNGEFVIKKQTIKTSNIIWISQHKQYVSD